MAGDLATLGLRIESQEAETAAGRMDRMAASADRAERATDSLGAGSAKANGAIATLLASVDRTTKELLELQRSSAGAAAAVQTQTAAASALASEAREASAAAATLGNSMGGVQAAMGSTAAATSAATREIGQADAQMRAYLSHMSSGTRVIGDFDSHMGAYRKHLETLPDTHGRATGSSKALTQATLNLTRQFADVGVTAAMGMNPLMIMIQQGPQIADAFQMAATQGLSFKAVMAGMWAQFAPILAILTPIIVLVAALGAAFALASRQASAEIGDLKNSLGLTEEQLKRLKKSGEETTVTLGDSFRGFGTAVKETINEAFGEQLKAAQGAFNAFLKDLTTNTGNEIKTILGFFIGTYNAIKATWAMLPAAIGDAAAQAAQMAVNALNFLIQKSVDAINGLRNQYNALPAWMRSGHTATTMQAPLIGNVANPNAGALASTVTAGGDAMRAGQVTADAMVSGFNTRWREATRRSAVNRLREAAGDPKAASDAGKSDAEKEYDRLMKSGEAYRLALVKERNELGLTALERKRLESETMANNLVTKGATDASRALAAEIRKEQKALEDATLAYEHSNAMKKQGQTLQLLELERELIGASNVERARQIAMLTAEIDLRNRLGALAEGYINSAAGQSEIKGAGDVAAAGAQNGNDQAAYNLGLEYQLDLLRQIDDQARAAGRGLADAFGTAGGALADVVTSMTGFRAQLEEINQAERRYRETVGEGAVDQQRLAMFARDRGQAEVEAYGNALSAAKGFFREGSDGYRVLQAAEAAFRVFQFAMSVQAMAQNAAETGASVAGSLAKGSAAAAAGAAKMFEALGPFAFPVVGAMIAILASMGLKGGGGGGGRGGGSGAPNSSLDGAVGRAQDISVQQDQTRQSIASSVAQKVEVRVTADRDGLQAYVVQTAADTAQPMIERGMAATGGATRALVMQDIDNGRTYSRSSK